MSDIVKQMREAAEELDHTDPVQKLLRRAADEIRRLQHLVAATAESASNAIEKYESTAHLDNVMGAFSRGRIAEASSTITALTVAALKADPAIPPAGGAVATIVKRVVDEWVEAKGIRLTSNEIWNLRCRLYSALPSAVPETDIHEAREAAKALILEARKTWWEIVESDEGECRLMGIVRELADQVECLLSSSGGGGKKK